MENFDFKIKKIRGLTPEVEQIHPLLKDLLPKLHNVIRVEYTHGTGEMGADFIVTIHDATLNMDEYIGVIVKCGDIRQEHESLERQIKECAIPRKVDGGRRQIYLNQIWIISNGAISGNAKSKIFEEYKAKNIKFIWDEILVELIEAHYPEYWVDMDKNIALYLSAVSRRAQDQNSKSGLLDITQGDFYIEQDVVRIEPDSRKKFLHKTKGSPTKLAAVLNKERFVFVEAGMGYGKSRLLGQAAMDYANHHNFSEQGILPIFINFRDLVDTHKGSLQHLLDQLKNEAKIDPDKHSLLFVVDAVDEMKSENDIKVKAITNFISQLMPHENMRAVFASRPFDDPLATQMLDHCVTRYALQPLSMQRLISFVEKLCDNALITSKLKSDLQRSDLFRSLPQTPISAILLGRVLNSDAKELPSTLPELYSKYLEMALGRWDIKKGSISEKEYETTVILVRLIAKFMFENDLSEIGLGDAREIIEGYLSKRETGQQIDKLFAYIISRSEVISVDELQNKLFFKHRTFMEFMYSEEIFFKHGKGAKIEHPFSAYWGAINYFYLGRLKDCPEKLNEIFDIIPKSELESYGKIMQSGQYLLAAYQSPYEDIIKCVKKAILETAEMYCRICEKPEESRLGVFSEVQLLAVMTNLVRYTFEYDFFERALRDIETDFLLALDSNKELTVAAFLVASIRAGMGHKDAFEALISSHLSNLPNTIKLGIGHASTDAQVTNDAIKRLGKKMARSSKENRPLFSSLYSVPLKERKDITRERPEASIALTP